MCKRHWHSTSSLPILVLVVVAAFTAASTFLTTLGIGGSVAGAAVASGWQQEWERTVAAAKKEGKVVIFGPPGERSRTAFEGEFRKAFPGISVEYSGGWGPAHVPKILEARQAGRYLADIYISGPEPGLSALKGIGMMQELMPALILPEVKDPKNWWLGKLDFIDKEKRYYLAFWAYPSLPFLYNTEKVNSGEIKSWWDIVQPKFKGKVAMYDPLVPGSMVPYLNFFLQTPELGEKYIRTLLDPGFGAVITRDDRQLAEWVGRGTHWIGVAPLWLSAAPVTKVLPVRAFPSDLREGKSFTSGFGNVAVLTGAPNHNAAVVYVNWLLSRAAQTTIAEIVEQPSGRVDVSQDAVPDFYQRKPNMKIFIEYYEEIMAGRDKGIAIAKEVLGR